MRYLVLADLSQLSAEVGAATSDEALQAALDHWTATAAEIIGAATFEVRELADDEREPPSARAVALHDLPIFGWAWKGDARQVER